MLYLQTAFVEVLLLDPTVAERLGRHIYPQVAPHWERDKEPAAHAVFSVVSNNNRKHVKGASRFDDSRMQVDVYSRNYLTAFEAGDAVRSAVDNFTGVVSKTIDGVVDQLLLRHVSLDERAESFEPGTSHEDPGWHRVQMDYLIMHESPTPVNTPQ